MRAAILAAKTRGSGRQMSGRAGRECCACEAQREESMLSRASLLAPLPADLEHMHRKGREEPARHQLRSKMASDAEPRGRALQDFI